MHAAYEYYSIIMHERVPPIIPIYAYIYISAFVTILCHGIGWMQQSFDDAIFVTKFRVGIPKSKKERGQSARKGEGEIGSFVIEHDRQGDPP